MGCRAQGGPSSRHSPSFPHSGKPRTNTPRTCFPGTEIVWKGGVRGLGLPHAAFPWAFWVRIIMKLLITSYLCISLKDLSQDVFTVCTPKSLTYFQDNPVNLWDHHPHFIGKETEAQEGVVKCYSGHAANGSSVDPEPRFP